MHIQVQKCFDLNPDLFKLFFFLIIIFFLLVNSPLTEEPSKYLPFFWRKTFAQPSHKDGLMDRLAMPMFQMRWMKTCVWDSSREQELLEDRLVPAELILASDQRKSGH